MQIPYLIIHPYGLMTTSKRLECIIHPTQTLPPTLEQDGQCVLVGKLEIEDFGVVFDILFNRVHGLVGWVE